MIAPNSSTINSSGTHHTAIMRLNTHHFLVFGNCRSIMHSHLCERGYDIGCLHLSLSWQIDGSTHFRSKQRLTTTCFFLGKHLDLKSHCSARLNPALNTPRLPGISMATS